jgi:competence ComEA-like helix-hairpin-helix protein
MGLFGFLNKKKKEEQEQQPHDVMLSLNQRQAPKEKSDVELKINNVQENIPLPNIIHQAPPATVPVEAFRTKSIDKKVESLPNIKKLVIPTQVHLSQHITQTDNSVVEIVKLHKDGLLEKEKIPTTNLVSKDTLKDGEFIDIPVSVFTDNIPPQFLSSSTSLFDNSSKVRFTKDEIIPILSQGVFAVVGYALLARLPDGLAAAEQKNTQEVFNIPLDNILPLVPPPWFMIQNQDTSTTDTINKMNNPFTTESDKEMEKEEEQYIKKSSTTLSTDVDPDATVLQDNAPNVFDPEETIIQKKIPPVESFDSEETILREAIPKSMAKGEQLLVPVERIKASLKEEFFSGSIPESLELKLPKDKVLSFLAQGNVQLSIAEFNAFSQSSLGKSDSLNELLQLDLTSIFDLIPPDWFSVQYEDTSKAELIDNMSDIFTGAFNEPKEENKTEEKETLEVKDDVITEVEKEVKEEPQAEEAVSSLITGGMFGKMSLFDDDEDEDIEIEEAVISVIEEQDDIAAPSIENEQEEIVIPVIEEEQEEIVIPVIEEEQEEIVVPVIEEEQEDIVIPVIEEEQEDIVIPVIEEEQEDIVIPVIEEEQEEIVIPVIEEEQEEIVIPIIEEESASIEDVYLLPGQGKLKSAFDIRPIAEDIAELKTSEKSRPSTAPNGIDINRSNLKDLCQLHSAGEKLALAIIDYREKNGPFNNINELKNVPGVGTSVYRSLTGLQPKADLVAAERKINKIVGFDNDKDYSLGKLIKQAQENLGFKSLILSDKDGFEICSSGDKTLLESNSEMLAATTPQLFKKTRHFLKQSNLPHPEIFTFYLDTTPVTFGVADQVFLVMVHSSNWPEPKHMKKCQELVNQLAWFCCHRAVV